MEISLVEWQKAHEVQADAEANLQDGHHLMAMLKVNPKQSHSHHKREELF